MFNKHDLTRDACMLRGPLRREGYYDKKDGSLVLVDEVEATHIGCEYGEYSEED